MRPDHTQGSIRWATLWAMTLSYGIHLRMEAVARVYYMIIPCPSLDSLAGSPAGSLASTRPHHHHEREAYRPRVDMDNIIELKTWKK